MRREPAGERFSTLADVFRNPQLRRLELSWAGFYLGEWTYFVALSVYAFEVGGAAGSGRPRARAHGAGSDRARRSAACWPTATRGSEFCSGFTSCGALLLVAMAVALAAESSRVRRLRPRGPGGGRRCPGSPGDALARADAGAHASRARRDQRLLEHAGGARDAGRPGDRRRPGRHGRRSRSPSPRRLPSTLACALLRRANPARRRRHGRTPARRAQPARRSCSEACARSPTSRIRA